jgi:hypothetical protein
MLYPLVYARDAYASLVETVLDKQCVVLANRAELIEALSRRPPLVFVDHELLARLDGQTSGAAVIAITDGTLDCIVQTLASFPWISNVISAPSLATPLARSNLRVVRDRLDSGPEHHMLATGAARVALLAHSDRREARLQRMSEFLGAHDVSTKTIAAMNDIAEELVTNALYDAPAEAGYFKAPVSRTSDVELPPEHACEISYGIEGDTAFVRVRDPFGSLTRTRMMSVLDRCRQKQTSFDESRGGAGLGLWRLFCLASAVTVTVISGRLTDVVARIEKRQRSLGKHVHTVQLFFPDELHLDGALGRFAADHDHDLMDDSFTAVVP